MFNFKNLISADDARKMADKERGWLNKDKINAILELWGEDIQDACKNHKTSLGIFDFCIRFNKEEQMYIKQILKGKGYRITINYGCLIIRWDKNERDY